MIPLDNLPGFRRRFVVRPTPGRVRSDVEDDYHCMGVVLHHDGRVATHVEADMTRVPWTTCPGAPAVLVRTFTGVALDAFGVRGEKVQNCTHLHDLAVLAAAHAHDAAPLIYDILVSDPVDGRRRAELRRNGETVLGWIVAGNGELVAPEHLAGTRLDRLRSWIDSLDAAGQEQARILRWGTVLAHGRARKFEDSAERERLPLGNCFTFQPENAPNAQYVSGTVREFSGGGAGPLDAISIGAEGGNEMP
ncbi:MAG TPA: hypothetical protein VMB71_04875 [Acetobacteraceae bacterium]|nr:hypothetical protein [Acetobacteraceae bacterium]